MASRFGNLTTGIAAELASLKKKMGQARGKVETNMERISNA